MGDVVSAETVLDAVGASDGGPDDAFAFGAPGPAAHGAELRTGRRAAGGFRLDDGVDTDAAGDFGIADFSADPGNANTPTASGGAMTGAAAATGTAVLISAVQGAGRASRWRGGP